MANWAAQWIGMEQSAGKVVSRDLNSDVFFARFEDNKGRGVKVRITEQCLKEFRGSVVGGNPAHTEQVLRAILQTYIESSGEPPAEIDAKDLGAPILHALKARFKAEYSK